MDHDFTPGSPSSASVSSLVFVSYVSFSHLYDDHNSQWAWQRELGRSRRRHPHHAHVPRHQINAAFDLLMLNGEDLRRKRYVERKAALRKLLRHDRGIQYVEHAEGHGDKMFAAVCHLWLEGHFLKETGCAVPLRSVEGP